MNAQPRDPRVRADALDARDAGRLMDLYTAASALLNIDTDLLGRFVEHVASRRPSQAEELLPAVERELAELRAALTP